VRSEAIAQPTIASGPGVTSLREDSDALVRATTAESVTVVPSAPPYPIARPAARSHRHHGNILRRLLVGFDVFAFTAGWLVALSLPDSVLGRHTTTWTVTLAQLAAGIGVGLVAMAVQRLYLARVCGVRAAELSRTLRAVVASGIAVAIVTALMDAHLPASRTVTGAGVAFVLAAGLRGIYGSMLRERRARGFNRRPIVIVGTNHEAEELAELVATHPEFGYEPVGVIGDRDEFESWSTSLPFLGPVERTTDLASLASANGALIAASSLEPTQLKRVTRDLLQTDLHVHLSSGLWGIDHRRLRSVPLAHEPIFYLERISISRLNLALKRVLDVVCAGVALIFATPVIAISAIAVKLYDRGPVLFRQVRVGKDGEHFHVYKLRTMVPNAEELVADLRETANFRDGPLFKMERDPRLTKVGRILEAASIDELPQLFNVLQGTMSLVGPRPALPSEAEQFDEELLERFSVPPGITGLWQVEARDNPSFRAYRRLDLFYVENWSITLDLAILVETAWSVVSRIFRGLK
jgi:exopolysaccharide biosynthesis polyprenyl glycosylphosphotransferase